MEKLPEQNKYEFDNVADSKALQRFRNMYLLLEQANPTKAKEIKGDFDNFENTLYEMSVESESSDVIFTMRDIEKRIPGNKFIDHIKESLKSSDVDWHTRGH